MGAGGGAGWGADKFEPVRVGGGGGVIQSELMGVGGGGLIGLFRGVAGGW